MGVCLIHEAGFSSVVFFFFLVGNQKQRLQTGRPWARWSLWICWNGLIGLPPYFKGKLTRHLLCLQSQLFNIVMLYHCYLTHFLLSVWLLQHVSFTHPGLLDHLDSDRLICGFCSFYCCPVDQSSFSGTWVANQSSHLGLSQVASPRHVYHIPKLKGYSRHGWWLSSSQRSQVSLIAKKGAWSGQ